MDPEPVQPSPKSFPLLPVLLILIALLLGSATFLTYQNLQLKKQLIELQTSLIPPISPITPTPLADPTANWKTYINPLGYSFQYPEELQLETSDNTIVIRIDPPNIQTIEGICPRYISLSLVTPASVTKTSHQTQSCVYTSVIERQKIFIETQYPQNKNALIDQILSTFKFLEPSTTTYTCPSNGWVDCMPGPEVKPECSEEAMNWYKTNCPDFEGGAL